MVPRLWWWLMGKPAPFTSETGIFLPQWFRERSSLCPIAVKWERFLVKFCFPGLKLSLPPLVLVLPSFAFHWLEK